MWRLPSAVICARAYDASAQFETKRTGNLLFWAFGFVFMFGSGNGIIGHQYFFLQGVPDTYGSTGVPMFLAGLVAITCPCYWASPTGAFILGAIAGVICVLSVDLFEYLRIDDPVGAVSVNGICGIWGTLSLGLFATGQFGAPGPCGADSSPTAPVRGLLYGGDATQVIGQ